jgi:pyruvate formate lyase activating enzyme
MVTIDEVVAIVEKERIFFDQSGGGVTFSGGEPLYQPDFLLGLLEEFGSRAIHRTVDTSGFVKKEELLEVAQHTDHFLYDLKMMDADRHRRWIGVDNQLIHSNLKALARTGASINIRIPVIKSVNDDDDNISRTAAFVAELPGEKKEVNILPYHNIMAGKHTRLGSRFDAGTMAEPSESELMGMVRKFADHGLHAVVGG